MENHNLLTPQELESLGIPGNLQDIRTWSQRQCDRALTGLNMAAKGILDLGIGATIATAKAGLLLTLLTNPGCKANFSTKGLMFCEPDPNNPMQCYVEPEPGPDTWDSIGADGSGEVDDPDVQEGVDGDTGEDPLDTHPDTDPIQDTFDQLDQLDQEGLIDIEKFDTDDILDVVPDETSEDSGEDTNPDTDPDIPVDPCEGVDCAPFSDQCNTAVCVDGDCLVVPEVDEECDDEDPCTEEDKCSEEGECEGTEKDCSDEDACTTNETCNTDTGDCESASVDPNDGNPCTNDSCDPQTGPVNIPKDMSDGNKCTMDECDPITGEPINTPVPTDDGNACTTDGCDPVTGVITHAQKDCNDQIPCTTDGCNTVTGACENIPNDLACDDENECTQEICSSQYGCAYIDLDNLECNNGNGCSIYDLCENGVCTGIDWKVCEDDIECTTDFCDDTDGECKNNPDNSKCDDNNVCTENVCDPVEGCQFLNWSVPCDDGNACSLEDLCDNGVCEGISWMDCDDGDECTLDSCNEVTGECEYEIFDCGEDKSCIFTQICADTCIGSQTQWEIEVFVTTSNPGSAEVTLIYPDGSTQSLPQSPTVNTTTGCDNPISYMRIDCNANCYGLSVETTDGQYFTYYKLGEGQDPTIPPISQGYSTNKIQGGEKVHHMLVIVPFNEDQL